MLKKIAIFFAYLIFFILSLIYFIPKASAYYYFESKLKKYDVIISNEEIYDKPLCLDITDADLFVKSIHLANITETHIHLFVLYNSVNINSVTLSNTFKELVPPKINRIVVSYSIFSPLSVNFNTIGDFGEAHGRYNFLDREINLKLIPSNLMLKNYQETLKQFIITEQGDYSYDKIF